MTHEESLFISWSKIFAIFAEIDLLNGGLNQTIFWCLFFGFINSVLTYFKSTLYPVLPSTFSESCKLCFAENFFIRGIFLTMFQSYNLVFLRYLEAVNSRRCRCTVTYHLGFCMNDRCHFVGWVSHLRKNSF